MRWDDFVVLWSTNLDTKIPQESVREWQKFVKYAEPEIMKLAVAEITERYHAAQSKKDYVPAPVLYELRMAYDKARRETQGVKAHQGCEFCEYEASANVLVLDNGNYTPGEFPPDPATFTGTRCISSVPCPCCRAGEYADQRVRERVRQYARPFSKKDELIYSPGFQK